MSRAPIPTIYGPAVPDDNDIRFMDYLDDRYCDAPDYGLLMFKGDPSAFAASKQDWLEEAEWLAAHS